METEQWIRLLLCPVSFSQFVVFSLSYKREISVLSIAFVVPDDLCLFRIQ